MSIADGQQSWTCEHCASPFDDPTYGSYCSARCETRAKGRKVLNQIESDRRICSTCYGHVRDTRPSTAESPDCFAGYQWPTERTVYGVDEFPADDSDRHLERTRWSCSCGAVDPNETHALLQRIHLTETVYNCYLAMAFLADQGAIADAPSWEPYVAAIRERSHDAAYACGTAVYG